jgi:hypothetical protein
MRCGAIFRSSALLVALVSSGVVLATESQLFGARNPEAPAGVAQYGQFAGAWTCIPTARQDDGSQKEIEARPTWIWYYALNGHAVQDVWIPDAENSLPGAAMGTNLRVYNPQEDEWVMVWATETLGKFQTFKAKAQGGNIVMHGDIQAGPHPAHLARITFHNVSRNHFDWKYEASAPGDGENWQLHSTLACDRSR